MDEELLEALKRIDWKRLLPFGAVTIRIKNGLPYNIEIAHNYKVG